MMHMIKLCVGVATLEELESYREERAHWWGADYGENVHVHRTRTMPKRKAEKLLRTHRPRKVEPLCVLDTQGAKNQRLSGALDAFDNDFETKRASQPGEREHGLAALRSLDLVGQGLVDLEGREWQGAEAGERGMSSSEIVDGEPCRMVGQPD